MKNLINKIKSSVFYEYSKIILLYSIFIIIGLILLLGEFVNVLILIKDIILVVPWFRVIGFLFGINLICIAIFEAYTEIKKINKKRKAEEKSRD